MAKSYIITILALTIIFSSCALNDPEHKDFEEHADCFVYSSEVRTENYSFGRVESIDMGKASECAKRFLRSVYLLYYDKSCIAVYNEHPKNDIGIIKDLAKMYQSDTTRLYDFVRTDNTIHLTVRRICKDQSDPYHYGHYENWKGIDYSTKPITKTNEYLITQFGNWKD